VRIPLTSVDLGVSLASGATAIAELSLAPPVDSPAYRPYLVAERVGLAGAPAGVSLTTSAPLTEPTVKNLIVVFQYEISPS
jgi:hypothetical protein